METIGNLWEKVVGLTPPGTIYFKRAEGPLITGVSPSYPLDELPEIRVLVLSTADEIEGPTRVVWGKPGEVQKLAWSALRRFISVDSKEITEEIVGNYYSTLIVPPEMNGHDICLYCGSDNGPNGEWREGFDCCQCGGN